jgi:hypothetical protein
MATFTFYVLDSASDTFKNLHVKATTEQEARNTATGLDAIVFRDGERGSISTITAHPTRWSRSSEWSSDIRERRHRLMPDPLRG